MLGVKNAMHNVKCIMLGVAGGPEPGRKGPVCWGLTRPGNPVSMSQARTLNTDFSESPLSNHFFPDKLTEYQYPDRSSPQKGMGKRDR